MSTAINVSDFSAALPQDVASLRWKWEGRFHALMAVAAAATVAISLAGYHFCNLSMLVPQAIPLLLLLLVLLAVAAQYRWRHEPKCFNVVMMAFWIILVTNSHYFPMYMAARSNVPMNDALLAAADRAMGLEVPTVMKALRPYPAINRFMLEVYLTLIPLMTLAAVVPPLANRMDKAKEYILGCIIAAAISLPIFAFVHAVGPWDYYDFPPAIPSLSEKADMLAALQTDSLFVIDVSNRDGLITFPSFHVVLTVLAAAALWPFRWLRWPAAIWAALIVISTVTTGIHYSIDVIGGLLVAMIAATGARTLLQWEWPPPPDPAYVQLKNDILALLLERTTTARKPSVT